MTDPSGAPSSRSGSPSGGTLVRGKPRLGCSGLGTRTPSLAGGAPPASRRPSAPPPPSPPAPPLSASPFPCALSFPVRSLRPSAFLPGLPPELASPSSRACLVPDPPGNTQAPALPLRLGVSVVQAGKVAPAVGGGVGSARRALTVRGPPNPSNETPRFSRPGKNGPGLCGGVRAVRVL